MIKIYHKIIEIKFYIEITNFNLKFIKYYDNIFYYLIFDILK